MSSDVFSCREAQTDLMWDGFFDKFIKWNIVDEILEFLRLIIFFDLGMLGRDVFW